MNPETYTVRLNEAGQPLVHFLARRLSISRRRAKQLMDDRNVLVNGQRVWMARHTIEKRDEIRVLTRPPATPKEKSIPVLEETDAYLIVNKPAGIVSNGPSSVETRLRTQLSCRTIQAVHRLDKDTTGCLLFAKNAEAFDDAVEAFRQHRVRKVYHAIVAGAVDFTTRAIRTPLEGRDALTRMRKLDGNRHATHLQIALDTGRKHQIRKHLRRLGHPILGDKTYAPGEEVTGEALTITRQMLHARSLEITIPRSELKLRATCALPGDFKRVLKAHRLT